MSSIFPANRVAAIAAFLTGIASALAGVESALPTSAANAVATAVGVIGALVTCLHFMSGSQKFDALQVQKTLVQVPFSTGSGTGATVTPIQSVSSDDVLSALQEEAPQDAPAPVPDLDPAPSPFAQPDPLPLTSSPGQVQT